MALNAKPGELLAAKGSSIDLGGEANAVPALFVERWLAGFMRVAVDPSDPTSLLVKRLFVSKWGSGVTRVPVEVPS